MADYGIITLIALLAIIVISVMTNYKIYKKVWGKKFTTVALILVAAFVILFLSGVLTK